MQIFLAIFQVLFWSVLSREIPSFVHVCHRRNPEFGKCIVNSMNELLPRLSKGIPELDIPQSEPLHVLEIAVNTGTGTPVQVDFKLRNGTIYGLSSVDVKHCDKDVDKAVFSCIMTFPFIRVIGTYIMKGKMMLFEINGTGPIEFNSSNVDVDGQWYGKHYMRNGEQHTNYEKSDLKLKIGKATMKMENAFPGNDELTESLNRIVNENMDSLKEELSPIIERTVAEISLDYLNRVYRLYPLKQLYPIP